MAIIYSYPKTTSAYSGDNFIITRYDSDEKVFRNYSVTASTLSDFFTKGNASDVTNGTVPVSSETGFVDSPIIVSNNNIQVTGATTVNSLRSNGGSVLVGHVIADSSVAVSYSLSVGGTITAVNGNISAERRVSARELDVNEIYGRGGLTIKARESNTSPRIKLSSTGQQPSYIMAEGGSFGINTAAPSYDLDIQSRSENSEVTRVGIGESGLITSTSGNTTLSTTNASSVRLAIQDENVLSVLPNKTVSIASIGVGDNTPLMKVNGGIKIGDSFQGNGGPTVEAHAGSLRYLEGPSASRLQIAMKTGENPAAYSWIDIQVQNY